MAATQPFAANWLLGRPLTEPYWLDTTIDGTPKRVLIQAFERRILTYAPDQPSGWQVESANVGLHYRLWRELSQPEDNDLISLASHERFGEEIVTAANTYEVDPFLLAAISRATSNGNPAAVQVNGGVGILAVRPDTAEALGGGDLHDPARNATYAAAELARRTTAAADTHSVLMNYYSGGAADPNDSDMTAFVEATLTAWDELQATHPIVFTAESEPPADGEPGSSLGIGRAAYYAASYDVAWWERTMRLYASWGNIAWGWRYDPNGYYCVKPGFTPGQRLYLRANGVEITCTIGDTVAQQDLANWNSLWVVELSWPTFLALGLDRNNTVEVLRFGPRG